MCQRFKVSRSGFYASQGRPPSAFAQLDAQLIEQVRQAHQAGRGYYGSPRVTEHLRHQGLSIGRGRVARLMRQARLQGHGNGLFRSKGPMLRFFCAVPNQIRSLQLCRTNQVWVPGCRHGSLLSTLAGLEPGRSSHCGPDHRRFESRCAQQKASSWCALPLRPGHRICGH
jgi:hypothetical protein